MGLDGEETHLNTLGARLRMVVRAGSASFDNILDDPMVDLEVAGGDPKISIGLAGKGMNEHPRMNRNPKVCTGLDGEGEGTHPKCLRSETKDASEGQISPI